MNQRVMAAWWERVGHEMNTYTAEFKECLEELTGRNPLPLHAAAVVMEGRLWQGQLGQWIRRRWRQDRGLKQSITIVSYLLKYPDVRCGSRPSRESKSTHGITKRA